MVFIYLEAVEQAPGCSVTMPKPYLCGVMAHLMLSATLWVRLVELLTKMGGVIFWGRSEKDWKGFCIRMGIH